MFFVLSIFKRLEDQLSSLQPDFESLMGGASDLIKDTDRKGPILELSRRMSGAHANLAIRKKNLKDADSKFNKMKNDLTNIQVWLQETEKALRSGDDPTKMKVIRIECVKIKRINFSLYQLGVDLYWILHTLSQALLSYIMV